MYYKNILLEEFFYNVKKFDFNEEEMEKVLDVIIINMIFRLQERKLSDNYMNDNGFKKLKTVINKIFEEENLDFTKIILLVKTYNLNVYRIGDKVLKLFNREKYFETPKSRYNVASVKEMLVIEDNKVGYEIMEYLKPLEEIYMEEQEKDNIVYDLYKKYREEGNVWVDPRTPNVGKSLKDNVLYFDGVTYGDLDAPLKCAEYANFDIEYIYSDGDIDISDFEKTISLSSYRNMEHKYLCEINKKN